ncbi:hypothetical protein LINPERHAP1_LOCUS35759 [Linum perenne]
MASLKAEKPTVGTQLFGQAPKKETTSTKGEGASKSAGSKAKKGAAAAAKPLAQGTKKKVPLGKEARQQRTKR